MEQPRWNQSNIDSMFHAGAQQFVNRYFGFNYQGSGQQFYFNILQQANNLITGYQRQNRKQIVCQNQDNSDPRTTDQYTKLLSEICYQGNIHEQFSKSCELSVIAGMNLVQPYLDFTGEDPLQGTIKAKVWEYNSFLVDPFFREPDMSDAQFVWTQEYLTKQEAIERFPEKQEMIRHMSGARTGQSRFYFLPESYYQTKNDLFVLSYLWYKSTRKRKKLFSQKRMQFFDFGGDQDLLQILLSGIDDLKEVVVDVPTWKVAVILNDQMMYNGNNPLKFDYSCPFIPVFWQYEPHLNIPDLRVRSLTRSLRDPQFLLNNKIIQNNDIASATINAGWKRKIGAVANEENLKKSGQGYDIIINNGYELSDCEKIIPSAVPQSDLALADQMQNMIYAVSGINIENWAGQDDKQISSLTMLMKQASNLMVFQKFFDQWDLSLKLLGERILDIALNNWEPEKVKLMIGEEPTEFFYSKLFLKYKTVVQEGLLTGTQRNLAAQQKLDMNAAFGREVFPPSMIIKDMNIQDKAQIMEFLQGQEKQASEAQAQQMAVEHAFEDARLQELYSKASANIAMARERHGRSEADIGLFEERLSEITRNRSLALRDKMEALEKLVDVVAKFGEIETMLKLNQIERIENQQERDEDREKVDAKKTAFSNEFVMSIMGQNRPPMAQ